MLIQRCGIAACILAVLLGPGFTAQGDEVNGDETAEKAEQYDFYEDWTDGIDPERWEVGTWREHGGQLSRERAYVQDEKLVLAFEYDTDYYEETGLFKGSAIQTRRDDFLYGRWEARLKIPDEDGVLPTMYTIDWRDGGGMTRQEIDIEFVTVNIGDDHSEVHLAVHGADYASWADQVELPFNPADDFHVWGFDIDEERIQWFVDDIVLYEYHYDEKPGRIDAPYTLKFNFWSAKDGGAGNWIQGPPEPDTELHYYIDWVRFREHSSAKTYYVDPAGGDDNNPGTEEEPWETMDQVESGSDGGDTIVILEVDEDLFAGTWPPDRIYQSSGVTRSGITWTFDDHYTVGRFANGDPWVVGPVDITHIDPLPEHDPDEDWYRNGCMFRLPRDANQALDSGNARGGYDHARNMGFPNDSPISAENPLSVPADEVVISAKSKDVPGERPHMAGAAILTVLAEAPPENAFRPSYLIGEPAAPRWTTDDLDWDWLESVQRSRDPVQERLSDPSDLVSAVEGLWWGIHSTSWTRQHWGYRPGNNGIYGREVSRTYTSRLLHVLLDYPREEIEDLVIGLVQIGLDTYAAAEQGARWGPNGGHFQGHLPAILFAGRMLDDDDIYKYVDAETYSGLGDENSQYDYVTQEDVDITQGGLREDGGDWNPDHRNVPDRILEYTEEMIGLPEWGIRMETARTQNNAHWSAIYRTNNTSSVDTALAMHIMGCADDVVRRAFLDYCDRFMRVALDDPSYSDPAGDRGMPRGPNAPTSLGIAMWEEYRADYPPVWPDSGDTEQ